MNFGKVTNPEQIDFTLPKDHADSLKMLKNTKGKNSFKLYVGCAKWNKKDLKNFYPKGTKCELSYYSTHFNSIELNATFYNSLTREQVVTWKEKTPAHFKFFPKITNSISHYKRLIEVRNHVEEYCNAAAHFEDQLGMIFLQMHDNFKPKDFSRVEKFVKEFPVGVPLAIEVRNAEWFTEKQASKDLYQLLEEHQMTNIIVDTAGRRDIMHMRLTSPNAFVRFVGANHVSDYKRLDDWIERIQIWKTHGLQELYFFIHQNIEVESALLSAYFIEKANTVFGTSLKVPKTLV